MYIWVIIAIYTSCMQYVHFSDTISNFYMTHLSFWIDVGHLKVMMDNGITKVITGIEDFTEDIGNVG